MDIPLPLFGAFKSIESARNKLIKSGFQGSIYIVAHSLGGVAVQDFAFKYPDFAKGIILLGGTTLRKYDIQEKRLQIPVISINGEMDGQVPLIL
jgi:pimeloyl-ACP methyl ester carboxylesterase